MFNRGFNKCVELNCIEALAQYTSLLILERVWLRFAYFELKINSLIVSWCFNELMGSNWCFVGVLVVVMELNRIEAISFLVLEPIWHQFQYFKLDSNKICYAEV